MRNETIDNQDSFEELNQALHTVSDFNQALDEHAILSVTRIDGKIIYINRKFREISGYSKSELIGQDHRIINSGCHPKEFFENLWSTILSGSVWRGEVCNRRKDGSIYWMNTTIVPFLDERKQPYKFIAIHSDITEMKLHAQQLKQMAHDLDQKNREMQSIVFTVSHDLRSPLRNVQGFASMLSEHVNNLKKLTENILAENSGAQNTINEIGNEMEFSLGFIHSGVVKIDDLLNGLLAVLRMGSAPLLIQDLDLNEVVKSSLAAMKFEFMEARVDVIEHDLHIVRGDRDLLGRVFLNLLGNALKYSSPTRQLAIEISSELKEDTVLIQVRDNGIGMSGDYEQRIFDFFYQMDPTNSEGQGMGLYIVRTALALMNGEISVTSQPDKGSIFTINLPRSFNLSGF
jgi:PAS domain S-box-containing protein